MNMSSSWTWNEVTLGDVSDFGTLKNHKIEFGDGAGQLAFKDASKMNAFGIIVRGTQFTGDMYLDNLLLWKADGTADTLQNFNTKKPDIEGIAKGKLIKANDKGDWGEDTKSGICMPRVIVTTKMQVSVQPGIVNAMFTANKASRATATLLNTMGQVIAQQSFTANAGMNKVQLSTNFRGPAVLIVKQGSQKNVQKITLR